MVPSRAANLDKCKIGTEKIAESGKHPVSTLEYPRFEEACGLQVSSMHLVSRFHAERFNAVSSENPCLGERVSAPASKERAPLRIALFGFGTVGSSVARILLESKPHGLELTHIYNRNVARKKADWVPKSVVWSEDWGIRCSRRMWT